MAEAMREMKDVGVEMTAAVDDVMRATRGDERGAAEQLARDRGVPVEAIRVQDVDGQMEREPYKISKRQAVAIDLILKGFSMTEVARRVGVTKRTVYRWRYNHPQFIAVYARITQELHEQTARRAEQLVYKAMTIVGDAMGEEKKESMRLSAATRVLNVMRVSKLLFASPGESHFNLALDEIIRKQRLQENIDPELPITVDDRKDALHLLEMQNVTEMADDEGGDTRQLAAEAERARRRKEAELALLNGEVGEREMTNDQAPMTRSHR